MNDKTPNKKRVVEASLGSVIDYELFDDGSVELVCPKCKEQRVLVGKSATDFLKYFKTNPDYKCMNCYIGQDSLPPRKSKFNKPEPKQYDDRSDQIAWNSAVNNANARVNAFIVAGKTPQNALMKDDITGMGFGSWEDMEEFFTKKYYDKIKQGHINP